MRFHVRDILPAIAEQYRTGGIDLCTEANVQKVLDMYNRINEILMNRDDWPGCDDHICIPLFESVFALPPRFESIKALRANGEALPVLPMGFRYLESGPGILTPTSETPALQHLGSYFATMRDLPRPLPVFAVSECDEVNATVTIHGTDTSGRHRRETITVHHAYPDKSPQSTELAFATITAIKKPVTSGHIELAGWDDATGEALWLTSMEPGETSPTISRYLLPTETPNGHIAANVSVAYRELTNIDEVSLIQHREAYRVMTQALAALDMKDIAGGSALKNVAIKMLKERAAKLARGQAQAIPYTPPRHYRKPYSVRGH